MLDIKKLKLLGWEPSISLEVGLQNTFEWFEKNYQNTRLNVSMNS